MSATIRRGFLLFGILVVFTAVVCVWLPFFALPKVGLGVGLPAIALPAEPLSNSQLPIIGPIFGLQLTNTFTTLIVVDVLMLLLGITVWRATSGVAPEKFVPRGFTNFVDILVQFWYDQAKPVLGEHTWRVLPMALTIFIFLMTANLIKLIPGFETVGIMTCAETGKVGYPLNASNPTFLDVSGGSLRDRAGTTVTAADQAACEDAHPENVAPKLPSSAPAPATGTTGTTTTTTTGTAGTTSTTTTTQAPNANLFNVVPYFRALATDLNIPLALAIVLFMAVQVWGVSVLGLPYFYKFINIPALGNLGKNPMGAMDFVVGLVDIISELSRLISLSFRLLGNIFAGGVLLAVMTFLMAGGLPLPFYGLELFAGLIQAYVFAILAVMYASQAVFAHHAEEHEEAHGEAAHTAHGEHAPEGAAVAKAADLG